MHEDPMLKFLDWFKEASSKLLRELQAAVQQAPALSSTVTTMRATLSFLTELNERAGQVPDDHPCRGQLGVLLSGVQRRALEGVVDWHADFRRLVTEHLSGRN